MYPMSRSLKASICFNNIIIATILFVMLSSQASAGQIHTAVAEGNLSLVKKLIASNSRLANVEESQFSTYLGTTPLYIAIDRGYNDIVKYLLDHGANPNFCGSNAYGCPLGYAVKKRNLKVVELLLKKGVSINAYNTEGPILFDVIFTQDILLIEYFLKKGASPSFRTKSGATLGISVLGSQMPHSQMLSILNLLMKYKMDVNLHGTWTQGALSLTVPASLDNVSMLQLAVDKGYEDIVKVLVKAGANVNSRDSDGDTPLWNARTLKMISLLESLGADLTARNKYGHPPGFFLNVKDEIEKSTVGGMVVSPEDLVQTGQGLHSRQSLCHECHR